MNSITHLTDTHLIEFIKSAKYRLHFIAPGVMKVTAEALAEQWKNLGADDIQIILDVDPEVCRLGYGHIDGLKLLQDTAVALGQGRMVGREPGIRIGVVIADGRIMVFSPTPLLIEAGFEHKKKTNCILIDSVPEQIAKDVGIGPNKIVDQKIGLDKASASEIQKVEKDIKNNPPLNFDLTRIVRVFNSRVEFVEFELHGCEVKKKRFKLPKDIQPFVRGNKRARELLEASFRLLSENETNAELSGEIIRKRRDELAKKFLISLPKYGTCILRTKKEDFEKDFNKFKSEVEIHGKSIKERLTKAIEKNIDALVKALLPAMKRKPPSRWSPFIQNEKPTDEEIEKLLRNDIEQESGSIDSIIEGMETKIVFKGVTYEMLTDKEFQNILIKKIPILDSALTEYNAAKADNPELEQASLF